jgi:hypothetical protein
MRQQSMIVPIEVCVRNHCVPAEAGSIGHPAFPPAQGSGIPAAGVVGSLLR